MGSTSTKTTKLTRVTEILKSTLKNLNKLETFQVYPIWQKWEEIVGPAVAKRSQPDTVKEGVLVVSVTHPVWLTELQSQKSLLLKKLDELKLTQPIQDIRFQLKKM